MFFIIISLIMALWFFSAMYLTNKKIMDCEGGMVGAIVIEILSLIAGIIVVSIIYSSNLCSIENITCLNESKNVYIEKRDYLQKQYTQMLDSAYKRYESDMYNKMTSKNKVSNININAQYSNMLIELSKKINQLNENIYNCDLQIKAEERDIRIYKRSMFTMGIFLTEYEK